MSRPLQFGDPPHLGPFRLQCRLHDGPAGIVYLGADANGRPVSVALLTRGAAADAAARDRFRAAVHNGVGMACVPAVLACDTEGPAPWVATAYEPGRAGAERYLDPVVVKGFTLTAGRPRGPEFQPYWAESREPAVPQWGVPADGPVSTVAAADSPRRVLLAGVAALTVLVLLFLLLLLLLLRGGAAPAPIRSPDVSPGPSRSSPGTAGGGGPQQQNPPGTAGVPGGGGGAAFGRAGPMTGKTLDGLGFAFRTPAGWVCLRNDDVAPPEVRWDCLDIGHARRHEGVGIVVRPCGPPCDATTRARLRSRLHVRGAWRAAGPATSYARWTAEVGGTRYVVVNMNRFWHRGGSRVLNAQVAVVAVGPEPVAGELGRIVADIRAHTP